MRAIIRTKHTTWRQKMQNPTQANLAPRERERINSALSSGSLKHKRTLSQGRMGSARSSRSVTISYDGDKPKRKRSRSISSIKSERKRIKERELMDENVRQLKRLQNAKASFDVTKWDRAERERQRLLVLMKQYPEPPIAELSARKPPMSKKSVRRHPTVSPSSMHNLDHRDRLPTLKAASRGQTPGSRQFRSVMPQAKANYRISTMDTLKQP